MTDTEPFTPDWWLATLSARLDAQQPAWQRFTDYYAGHQPLAFATSKFREAFGNLFRAFANNWCALVVDASVERLTVQGFRFGDDTTADADAWAIWQTSSLDAGSRLAHTEAVKTGSAYLLVSPPDGDGGRSRITPESSAECVVALDPADPRHRLAGLKRWTRDDGVWLATLYLPDSVHRFESRRAVTAVTMQGTKERPPGGWIPRADQLDSIVPNAAGVVPLIPLANNPQLATGGQSDLVGVLPLQDAVNKLVSDMIVASEYAAFRQRWATGLEVPTDPTTGVPLKSAELKAAMSRLWAVDDPNAKFGEFEASDLSNYVKAVEMLVQHVAAQTRTPPHYLLGQSGAFPSGESLKSTETGLVAKVKAKQATFGEAWEEGIRVAFAYEGDSGRASVPDVETIWADPESRTEGEHVDALLKMQTLGVPQEALWERAGFSPTEIARFRSMQTADALLLGGQFFQADPADPGVPVAAPGATPTPGVAPGPPAPAAPAPGAPVPAPVAPPA